MPACEFLVTVARARVSVDSRAAALVESGDVVMGIAEGLFAPSYVRGELGEVVLGRVEGRTADHNLQVARHGRRRRRRRGSGVQTRGRDRCWHGADVMSFALPFWLLRMKPGPILFSSYASGFDDAGVSIRPEDIERPGPKTSPSPPTEPAAPLSPWT